MDGKAWYLPVRARHRPPMHMPGRPAVRPLCSHPGPLPPRPQPSDCLRLRSYPYLRQPWRSNLATAARSSARVGTGPTLQPGPLAPVPTHPCPHLVTSVTTHRKPRRSIHQAAPRSPVKRSRYERSTHAPPQSDRRTRGATIARTRQPRRSSFFPAPTPTL